ncbi:MAG: PKD domain-containing protein [Agriterribacter sp.]
MKRIILFLPLLLLIYINSQAGNKDGKSSLALVANFTASVTSGCSPLNTQFTSTSSGDAGDPIVSYSWNFGDGSPASTAANPTHTYNNNSGNHIYYNVTLTVTTQSGATATETKNSYIFAAIKPAFNLGADYVACEGEVAHLETVSGIYYDYAWNPPYYTSHSGDFSLNAGLNTISATVSVGGCSVSDTINITAAAPLTPKFGYTVLSSCGGEVKVQFYDSTTSCNAANGVGYIGWLIDGDPYEESNPVHTFYSGGSHNVYLFVSNMDDSYSTDMNVTIELPNPTAGPSPIDFGGDKTICAGGSVQLDAGDEPGTTYAWTPATGLSSTTIYNPVASPASTQTYTVTKTKCGVDITGTVTVNVNAAPVVNLGADQQICPGGFVEVDAGNAPATYDWSTNNGMSYYNTKTSQKLYISHAGTYWVEVTKNGCKASDTVVVTMKEAVTAAFTATPSGSGSCGPFTVAVAENAAVCTGSIADHSWDFGDGTVITGYNQSYSHTYSAAGTYTITLIVTTTNNDKDTISHTVSYTGTAFSVNLGNDTTICAGNNITIDAGAGSSYSWSNGETGRTITVSPSATTTYSVAVTNSSGCTASDSKIVTVGAAFTVNLGADQQICPGGFVEADAGNAPATYDWSTDNGMSYYNTKTSRKLYISHAGTYWVEVTKNGCKVSDTVVVTVKEAVTAAFTATPSGSGSCGPFTVAVAENAAVCTGSIADHSWDFGDGTIITGYNQSYNHTYSAPGTYTITLIVTTDNNDKDTIPQTVSYTGETFSVNLGNDTTICAGNSVTIDAGAGSSYSWSNGETGRTITVSPSATTTYDVTVTSASGCTATDSKTVNVGSAVSVNLGNDTTICSGSSITLDAGPGASYSWLSGETTRTITVSPTVNTNYGVTVTSASGCTGSDSKTVNVGSAVSVDLGNDTTICSGSSVTIDAGAGSSYSWSTGAITRTITVSPTANTTYSVTVTNASGCTGSDSKTVNVGSAISVNLGNDTTICSGSSITLDAGPGASYSWLSGETTRTITVNPTVNTNYSVTVTSASGCTGSDSKLVNVGAGFTVNLGADTAFCPGGFITLKSGVSGATYLWGSSYAGGGYNGKATQNLNVLHTGTFWVSVTKNGCVGRDTIQVSHKDTIVAKFNTILAGSGSCGPYTVTVTENSDVCTGSVADHSWDFGDGTVVTGYNQTYSHDYVTAGDHTIRLIVTTTGGTKDTIDHIVSFTGSSFTVNLGNDTTICSGSSITLDAGNAGATYTWSNGQTGQSISVAESGTYAVEVNNGLCKARDTIQVTVSGTLNINLGNDTTVCPGNSLVLDAGYAGATYAWSANANYSTLQNPTVWPTDPENVYTVTVTQGACSGTGTIKVYVNSTLPVNLGNDTTICSGSFITLDAGYPGATYLWSDGQSSQTNTVNGSLGVYKVTVDLNGCTGEGSINISLINPPAPVNLGEDINVCFGNSIMLDAGEYAGLTYLWSTGETTRTITVSSSGTYSVTVAGCGAPVTDEINVTMGNISAPVITQSGLELICTQADSYQWYKDGILIPGATNQRYKPRGYGNYSVVVTNTALGCSGKSADYWFVPSGDFYLGDIRVKITPNPGGGQTKLVLSKLPEKPIKVTIYDRIGRSLTTREVTNKVTDINMTMYAKGLYFAECILDNNRVILPLVTQ